MLLKPNKTETKEAFVKRFARDVNMQNQCGLDVIEIAEQQWSRSEAMKSDIEKHMNDKIMK
jgi:hypothetical protein